MKIEYNPFQNLPLLIAGVAVVLFSSAGIARISGWDPVSSGGAGIVIDGAYPSNP
jgi:hypothetical protein